MSRATFLSISDPRGDVDFVSSVIDVASRRDVQANAIFVLGNLVGAIVTPEERPVYLEARKILESELTSKRQQYIEEGVRDITSLGHVMTANPDHYRRGEIGQIGRHDDSGTRNKSRVKMVVRPVSMRS